MSAKRDEIYREFTGKLPNALLNHSFWSGMAFIPVLVGLVLAYLVGFETIAGKIFVWSGVAVTALVGLYVSYMFLKARWHAMDVVNQGETNG